MIGMYVLFGLMYKLVILYIYKKLPFGAIFFRIDHYKMRHYVINERCENIEI